MTDNQFEIPDLGDLNDEIEDAMKEAQKAMEDIPNITGLGDIMGSLSSLVENLPDQMGNLSSAMEGFSQEHEANSASLIGEPDWKVEAEIKVGQMMHLRILAEFDLGKLKETWESTQGAGFEDIVGGVVADAEVDLEDGMFGQIMDQLKQGRGSVKVIGIDVLACQIQGAPSEASSKLELSPEANIPLVLNDEGIGFEFAPMLTIKNRWENATIPTFSPMADEIVVPMSHFASNPAAVLNFSPGNQEFAMEIDLKFYPLE